MRRIREKYDGSTTDFTSSGEDDDGSTSGLMGWIQTTDLKKFGIYALIVAFIIILLSIIMHHFVGVREIKKF